VNGRQDDTLGVVFLTSVLLSDVRVAALVWAGQRLPLDGCIIFDTVPDMERSTPLVAVFYRTSAGNEPVREWLQSLTKPEKFRVGVDIWKVQSEWPIGMPHVRPLGSGLHEVRSRLP
jgi:hypothetical protein